MAKITKVEMPALAEQIVKCLGGKENVARINHCATRLRVNPVDMEKVDKDGLKRLHGVIGIDSSKAELQIIVGAIIEDLYLEVEKITGNGILNQSAFLVSTFTTEMTVAEMEEVAALPGVVSVTPVTTFEMKMNYATSMTTVTKMW